MRKTKSVWNRVVSVFISLTMIISLMIIVPSNDIVNAATALTSTQIVNYFESRVGQTATKDSCLAWMADGFHNLGAVRSSACCAWNYGNTYCTHSTRDDIPIGADVFFNSEGTKVDAIYHGHHCGHIGVYVGNGYIVHVYSGKIQKTKIDTVISHGYIYRGWGIHGNISISDVPSEPFINITSYSLPTGKLEKGKSFGVQGVITSYPNLKRVWGGVYTRDGSKTDEWCDVNPNSTTYNLATYFDANIIFNNLPIGYYTYKIEATTTDGQYKCIQSDFQIGDPPPSTYTVTLNPNGGSVSPTSITVSANGTYSGLTNPSKTGYTFAGWYTSDGIKKENGSGIASNSNHTLVAHWTANTYTVAFNANGGSGSMSDQTLTYDQEANLTENAFTKTGYSFDGWNTNADGLGTSYADKASVKNLATSGTVTLYAKWTANKYTVKFDGNGADELSTASKEVTYNSTYGELPQPKRDGYNFIGWYTKTEGGTAITPDAKVAITGTQTLYAQWSQVKFLITFNATGGTAEASQKLVTYDKAYGVLPTAERTGYEFKGWYLDEDYTQQITSDTIVALTANQAVYAKWELQRYVITFDATGGTAEADSKLVTFGKTYGVLPSATRANFVFKGWYTENGDQITSSNVVDLTSNITLYAKWEIDGSAGDINLDGKVNVADAVLLQGYLLGRFSLNEDEWKAADLLGDGTVDAFDMVIMRKILIKAGGN